MAAPPSPFAELQDKLACGHLLSSEEAGLLEALMKLEAGHLLTADEKAALNELFPPPAPLPSPLSLGPAHHCRDRRSTRAQLAGRSASAGHMLNH